MRDEFRWGGGGFIDTNLVFWHTHTHTHRLTQECQAKIYKCIHLAWWPESMQPADLQVYAKGWGWRETGQYANYNASCTNNMQAVCAGLFIHIHIHFYRSSFVKKTWISWGSEGMKFSKFYLNKRGGMTTASIIFNFYNSYSSFGRPNSINMDK